MSTRSDSPTPPAYMSQEAWDDLGPMGRMDAPSDVIFDRDRTRTGETYAGAEERETPVRPYHPHVLVGYRHALANPLRERDFTDFEAGHALHGHYQRTLMAGGQKAVELLMALARTGNEQMIRAAEIRHDGGAHRTAEEEAVGGRRTDEEESLEGLRSRGADGRGDFTVVAPTESEARVVRSMIDWALKLMPPENGLRGQTLILREEDLPSAEEMKKALGDARPALFSDRPDSRKMVGVIASLGMERQAIDATKRLNDGYSLVPGQNRDLWSILINEGDKRWRQRVEFEKAVNGRLPGGAVQRNNEKVVAAADRVIVAWNGHDDDAALAAVAHAARRGKLWAVVDSEGKVLNLDKLVPHAMRQHVSRVEWVRQKNAGVFEIPAGSPEGRLGLSLIRGLPRIAAEALAKTDYTLAQIVDMAKDPEGQKTLYRDHKIAGNIIKDVLGDDRTVSEARESLMRIMGHAKDHGVTIVGPESFPKALAEGDKAPPVLFVKAQDPAALTALDRTVALVGDEGLIPHMARPASELAIALDRPGTTLVQAEDQGMPQYVPENPSILVLSTGHGQFAHGSRIEWSSDAEAGEIVGKGVSGATYAIALEGDAVRLRTVAADGAAKELKSVKVAASEDRTIEQAKVAAVRFVKDVALKADDAIVQAPLQAFRDAIVARGGFVVSALPPVETNSVYSAELKTRVGMPALRTDDTRATAVELASRLARTTVVTQVQDRSVALRAVQVAAETRRPLVAISPPENVASLGKVAGNIALLRVNGADLPSHLGLSGTARTLIEKAYGGKPAAIRTGRHMTVAAERIGEMLDGKTPEAVKRRDQAAAR